MTFTAVSWNVNGVRPRLAHVLRYLDERAPDVLCLQETKVAHGDFPREAFQALGYRAAVLSSGGYAGVAILARAPFEREIDGLDGFQAKRDAARRLACRVAGVWIDNVYVPTRMAIGKEPFLDALREDHARRFGAKARVILCGDFNICYDARDYAHPRMIAQSDVHPNRPEDRALRRLLDDRGLVDCFRVLCPDPGHYSWFGTSSGDAGMRLDYLFASRTLAEDLVACVHDRDTRTWSDPSDHVPVRATFHVR